MLSQDIKKSRNPFIYKGLREIVFIRTPQLLVSLINNLYIQ